MRFRDPFLTVPSPEDESQPQPLPRAVQGPGSESVPQREETRSRWLKALGLLWPHSKAPGASGRTADASQGSWLVLLGSWASRACTELVSCPSSWAPREGTEGWVLPEQLAEVQVELAQHTIQKQQGEV